MNTYVKNYAIFIGFLLVTKIVVVPLADKMSIPYLSDL